MLPTESIIHRGHLFCHFSGSRVSGSPNISTERRNTATSQQGEPLQSNCIIISNSHTYSHKRHEQLNTTTHTHMYPPGSYILEILIHPLQKLHNTPHPWGFQRQTAFHHHVFIHHCYVVAQHAALQDLRPIWAISCS